MNRIAKWDNAKALLIILVVVGHLCDYHTDGHPLLQGLFVFIYSFHMPLFILIVGLFAKRACTSPRFPATKVFGYLVLALACSVIIAVVRRICGMGVVFTVVDQDALSWFLVACAVFISVTWLFRDVDFRYLLGFALVLGIFAGYDPQIDDTLALSRIIVYYPFFLIGYRLDGALLARRTSTWWARLLGAVVVVAFLVVCLMDIGGVASLRLLFTGHNPFAAVPGSGAVQRLLCYAISAVMCLAVMCAVPERRLPFLSVVGERTLAVYILHVPLIFVLLRLGVDEALIAAFGFPVGVTVWLLLSLPLTAVLCIPLFDRALRRLMDCAARPVGYNGGTLEAGRSVGTEEDGRESTDERHVEEAGHGHTGR